MSFSWTALNRPDGAWIQSGTAPNRVFTRALGLTEAAFYWDGQAQGTADLVERTGIYAPSLRILDPSDDEQRFRAVWAEVKRRYPLIGARVDELDGGQLLQFVVEEERLQTISGRQEFEFVADANADSVAAYVEEALNGRPRRLSSSTLVGVTILRRTDLPAGTYDILTVGAHLILDGMSSCSLARSICEVFSNWPNSKDSASVDLPKRLEMLPSPETLHRQLRLSRPHQRWRKAIASVIFLRRISAFRNGHTLPRTWNAQSPRKPTYSAVERIKFSSEVTSKALIACRAHNLTLGNTLYILGQVAMSRVLHRRVKRGDMFLDEWDARLKSPMHTGGPLNLRPFVVPEWQQAGGMIEINVCIGFFVMTLPFLPYAKPSDKTNPLSFEVDATGAPPLASLLSRERFWYRTTLAKERANASYRHPLFLEMLTMNNPARVERGRAFAEAWRKIEAGEDIAPLPEPPLDAMVFTHIGSSMGNIDLMIPRLYPQGQDPPTVERLGSDLYLRCRPGELYMGAKSSHGETEFWVFYDHNAYQRAVVREWIDEIRAAVEYYLG
uniref:Condensation domain-containing protein n=1 Tax=Mycena chlorophos TaxID=658473 RepID=A0ABQ0LI21_MYCCL|nr:predicted protein [Mycena chlorophos]